MSEWKEYIFEDIIDKFIDYRGKTPNKTTFGIPLVTAKIVKGGRLLEPNEFIAEDDYETWMTRGLPEINDVVLTTEAPLGEVALIKNKNVALAQRIITLQTKKEVCDGIFLKYYLQSKEGQGLLQARASGSTVEGIKSAELKKLKISIPKLSEQIQIASILSSLDDKIDLLHRQNKILEQLAEMLFRQWFVKETEESWEEIRLENIADHYKENINPSKNANTIFYHYSLPAFDDGKNPVAEMGKEILSNKYKVIPNSILVSKLNPRVPRIWALYGNDIGANSICSTEFQIVKPKQISYFGFIYCFLKSYQVTHELANSSSGTSGSHQRVNPKDIFNLSFLRPPNELIQKFDEITKDFWVKIQSNTNQIRTLTQLRDTLLPKLMSGEVRVKN